MDKKSKVLILSTIICFGVNNTKILCSSNNNISGEICDYIINNINFNRHEIRVHDVTSLSRAIKNSNGYTKIICDNDIDLDENIEIKSSIILDLNGHKIKLIDNAKFIIGEKIFDHIEYKTIHHPGRYVPNYAIRYVTNENGEVQKIQEETSRVWEPGWNETVSENIYRYSDDLDIIFENGSLYGCNGKDGTNGKPDSYFTGSYGQPGEDGREALNIISGTVRVRNMYIIGGNGGNGGNGTTQKILHIPIFTGNGGLGGNGGKSGPAVLLERKECKIKYDTDSVLKSGLPGFGGKGAPANPNHWIGRGIDGEDGQNGLDSQAIFRK